jgi:hypothetical protein
VQLEVHTTCRARPNESLPVDEQARIMNPAGRAARNPFGELDGEHSREQRVRDCVHDENATWSKNSTGLADHAVELSDVFEDLAGADHVSRPIGEGGRAHIGSKRDHAV